MKAATLFLFAIFFEVTSPFSPFAFAQGVSSGVLTPIASNIGAATPHKPRYQHRKSQKHPSNKHSQHSFLPANEQYASLSQANAHCPPNTVEWAVLGNSQLYHNSQSRWFGHTKHGAYACKGILDQAGFRAGK